MRTNDITFNNIIKICYSLNYVVWQSELFFKKYIEYDFYDYLTGLL